MKFPKVFIVHVNVRRHEWWVLGGLYYLKEFGVNDMEVIGKKRKLQSLIPLRYTQFNDQPITIF